MPTAQKHHAAFEKRKARDASGGVREHTAGQGAAPCQPPGLPAAPPGTRGGGHRGAMGSRSSREPRLPPSEAEGRTRQTSQAGEGTHSHEPPQGRCTSAGNLMGNVLSTTGYRSMSPGCNPVIVTVATVTVAWDYCAQAPVGAKEPGKNAGAQPRGAKGTQDREK